MIALVLFLGALAVALWAVWCWARSAVEPGFVSPLREWAPGELRALSSFPSPLIATGAAGSGETTTETRNAAPVQRDGVLTPRKDLQ